MSIMAMRKWDAAHGRRLAERGSRDETKRYIVSRRAKVILINRLRGMRMTTAILLHQNSILVQTRAHDWAQGARRRSQKWDAAHGMK